MTGVDKIKMDGACFRVGYVLSFASSDLFISSHVNQYYEHLQEIQRKKMLKTIWQLSKKAAKTQDQNGVQTNVNAS